MDNEVMNERALNIDKSNWTPTKLGDVLDDISKRVDNPSQSEYDRFVGLEHFVSGDIKIKNWGSTESLTSSTKAFQAGDILFARRNAYLRRASLVDFEGCCSGDAFVLRENYEKVVPGFMAFVMNSIALWDFANENAAGTMSQRVKWRDLANYEFLLPPKSEQARMAELLWAMDEVIEERREIKEKCEILIKSFVSQFFENSDERKIPFLNTGDWKSGGTPNKKNMSYWSGDIPWVSPKDMKSEFIEDSIDKITLEGANSGSKIIPPNSILIVVRGMILLHSFPVAITGKAVAFNQDVKALLPNSDFLPKTLFYFLKNKSQVILSLSSESSHGTKSIPSNVLFGMEIPLITKEDQKVFVKKIEVIEATIVGVTSHIESSKILQKSLINQIF